MLVNYSYKHSRGAEDSHPRLKELESGHVWCLTVKLRGAHKPRAKQEGHHGPLQRLLDVRIGRPLGPSVRHSALFEFPGLRPIRQ